MPPGDILIHTGDFTNFYSSLEDGEDFNKWLGRQPFKYKLVLSGNHDYFLTPRQRKRNKELLSNATHYLEDSAVEIEGLKFWGSPWHVHRESILYWANNFGCDEQAIREKWNIIPADTDILLTHFPSFGTVTTEGCPYLTKTILEKIRPKIHIFGHHHPSHGAVQHIDGQGTITFVNAANHILGTNLHPHVVLDYYFNSEE